MTGIRSFGRGDLTWHLSRAQFAFTAGAGGCDLVVPTHRASQIAPLHATIERIGSGLRVRDEITAHGVFRALRGPRVDELHVEAGDVFWLADVALLATDARLERLRDRVAWCVGLDRHVAVDEAIEAIAQGRPLVLAGPPGTDARWLAEAAHEASPQRDGRFVAPVDGALPAIDELIGATVFIELANRSGLPAPFVHRLFDPTQDVRAIFTTPDVRRACAVLDTYASRAHVVPLCPLRHRSAEIVRLVAMHWRDVLRTGRRVEELPRIEEIARYTWPRGFAELRSHSARLLSYLEHGGLRPAARELGVAHQTLAEHFRRIGFPCLDQEARDAIGAETLSIPGCR